jgi:hypothetical protein
MKKTRRTRQQWQQMITDWQHSGQSVAEFCKEQHLTLSNFYLWRKRLDTDDVVNIFGTPQLSSFF